MGILSNNKNFQRVLEFPDNRLMIELCGQLDYNLSKIEHEISVQILRKGNVFEISGDESDCRLAVTVLQSLYSQLEAGKVLESGDIDAAIRMPDEFFEFDIQNNLGKKKSTTNSKYFFEIVTRKKTVLPRTKVQKQYAKSLLL